MFADNFVEMPDGGKMNWCCGAGGGVSANERADEIRLKVFERKKAQLDEVKPDGILSAPVQIAGFTSRTGSRNTTWIFRC